MRHDRIRAFYEENRQGLYTYALSLTGRSAAAEDAVHTVICKLLQRLVLPRSLKPYAYRCVRNAVVDDWRKDESRQESILDLEHLAAHDAAINHYSDIENMLSLVGHEEREVIILKAIDGLTFQEIANVCRTSINTVASRYRRGLEKLKGMLQEELQ
ncbi:MAG: sigma-70 family RNA polymerase sigma factor [Verrucomicrobia bacterium]|nr:sigma-70 family RNA polymerase sigma factor [Verrucomicrobiota bacterium]MCG2680178.1 sigma-70 family RNA polymerase sigma factor [Kiritimatiellia bacterium]MBU4247497.1 sigma-70 family RNA polymerase sigma factor [Verrucomicrobiota bacterium]MBU4289466.1 sigma-70 family RNA polymerase sigma factor [Verrucomicrobiota bacterium]MBU4429631.1 sigma-70 family RNA polymerase sigma factor [Verrucomicrobiota bacterium]